MLKTYGQLLIGILIGLLLGIFIGRNAFNITVRQPVILPSAPVIQPQPTVAENVSNDHSDATRSKGIPQKVYDVLKYVKANNHAMPGYVGGRIFSNREELLPRQDKQGKPILYHEWDVNPKVQGRDRGTERIITGSDERAWYTNDHYQTFREIK